MTPKMRGVAVWRFSVGLFLFMCAAGALFGDVPEKAADGAQLPESVQELPEMSVSAGLPWRFAEANGFQILSSASDKAATRFLAEFWHEVALCRAMLPGDLLPEPSSPIILILHADKYFGGGTSNWAGAGLSDRESFDVSAFMVNVEWFEANRLDPHKTGLYRLSTTSSYVEWLMDCRQPKLPRWFAEGVKMVLSAHIFGPDRAAIGGYEILIENVNGDGSRSMRKSPVIMSAKRPLSRLFEEQAPTEPLQFAGEWKRQAGEFLLWGLASDAHRAGFFDFVRRASAEGSSETLFEQCFGMSSQDGGAAVARMVKTIRGRSREKPMPLSAQTGRGRADVAKVEFRPARRDEMVRSIGEWQRQVAMLVEDPEKRKKSLEDVRTMLRSHIRSDRPVDHALLASLALCELALGETASAREYLEVACRSQAVRARAWLELARLRYAEAIGSPKGTHGKLSADQVEEVAAPLRVALGKTPVSLATYRLWVELWRNSEVLPRDADTALLLKGRELFPAKPAGDTCQAVKAD